DFVGQVVLQGRGAGAGPTASAVVADLIDIARGRATPVWGAASGSLAAVPSLPMTAHSGAYYLRLMVVDRPGVIADVTAILRDHRISLESMLQRGRAPGEAVPVVLTTHDTGEGAMRAALEQVAGLDAVLESPTLIRIEPASNRRRPCPAASAHAAKSPTATWRWTLFASSRRRRWRRRTGWGAARRTRPTARPSRRCRSE